MFAVRELVNYVSNKVSPFRASCSLTHGSAVEPVPLTVANTTAFESAVWTSAAAAFQLIAAVVAVSTVRVKVPPAALPILTLIVRQMYPELMTFVI